MLLFLIGYVLAAIEMAIKWWFTKCRGATTSVVTFIPLLTLLTIFHTAPLATLQTINSMPMSFSETVFITMAPEQGPPICLNIPDGETRGSDHDLGSDLGTTSPRLFLVWNDIGRSFCFLRLVFRGSLLGKLLKELVVNNLNGCITIQTFYIFKLEN